MNSASWWADKMSQSQGRPNQKFDRSLPPTPVARPQSPQPVYQPPQPAPERGCPECGSPHYKSAPNSAGRCFECNFMEGRDFRNSTQGLNVPSDGDVRPAMQVQTNYTPNQVIGKI